MWTTGAGLRVVQVDVEFLEKISGFRLLVSIGPGGSDDHRWIPQVVEAHLALVAGDVRMHRLHVDLREVHRRR
jgi:hypothetical protein